MPRYAKTGPVGLLVHTTPADDDAPDRYAYGACPRGLPWRSSDQSTCTGDCHAEDRPWEPHLGPAGTWVTCPVCWYAKPAGQPCGLPCV